MSETGQTRSRGGAAAAYIPPYALLKSVIALRRDADGRMRVDMPLEAFGKIFELALRQAGFDEAGYVRRNPDVAAAIARGALKSGLGHFARNGFFEDRPMTPPALDAAFYLKEYPDVGRSIAQRKIESADDHWTRNGFQEGRAPSAELVEEVSSWLALVP
jgi:hypothetical protein